MTTPAAEGPRGAAGQSAERAAMPGPRRSSAAEWLRHNLFRSSVDAVVTVLGAVVATVVLYRSVRFVFVTGRWDVVRANLRLLLIGRYPESQTPRLVVAVVVLGAWAGLIAGIVHARQARAGRPRSGTGRHRVVDLAERLWIPAVVVLLLLALTATAGPWITAAAAVLAAAAGHVAGSALGGRAWGVRTGAAAVLVLASAPVALHLSVAAAAGYDRWGGFMLNLFLAACAIVLSFPFGVLLALGRRSRLPVVRVVSTAYIELVRACPLFVLLLFAHVALGFFVPQRFTPSAPTRAIIVFTLFTAAYLAEVVRGGLQSVPKGQFEAARAIGLSPVRQTFLIVLPQALRNVIPAQIGQLISLFKDTTLAGVAMSLFELLTVTGAVTQQPEFRGQGLIGETIAFGALLFWAVSYTMSRESQRLERKLGVGVR